jgi:hypothetical protein
MIHRCRRDQLSIPPLPTHRLLPIPTFPHPIPDPRPLPLVRRRIKLLSPAHQLIRHAQQFLAITVQLPEERLVNLREGDQLIVVGEAVDIDAEVDGFVLEHLPLFEDAAGAAAVAGYGVFPRTRGGVLGLDEA